MKRRNGVTKGAGIVFESEETLQRATGRCSGPRMLRVLQSQIDSYRAEIEKLFAQHRRKRASKSYSTCLSRHLSSGTGLFPTSISRGGRIGGHAKLPESPASKSSRCFISTIQIAESMGLKGEFRQWEDLLRVGE
jgi:hypothetical protein